MENQQEFKLGRLLGYLNLLNGDVEKFNEFQTFVLMCREVTKIFMEMGGILKKAFEDIKAKCDILQRNQILHQHGSLIEFLLLEKEKDIAKLNGENTQKFGYKKGDFYFDYESSARTILRLLWFLDFVYELINSILQDEKKSLSSICSDAYQKSLAPHHSFAIRTGVKAGLLTVGNRENLYKILFKENEERNQSLIFIRDIILKIKTRLWTILQDCSDLP